MESHDRDIVCKLISRSAAQAVAYCRNKCPEMNIEGNDQSCNNKSCQKNNGGRGVDRSRQWAHDGGANGAAAAWECYVHESKRRKKKYNHATELYDAEVPLE